MYSINFTKINTKSYLRLHYNGDNSYLFVYGTEIHKFKAKNSGIVASPLWINPLNGYVYDFSVDYDAIAVDDILDIHKYLMEKNNIK